MYKLIFLFLVSIGFSQYDYSLEDLNSSSSYYQENVGTSFFENKVTIHYFGYYY